MRSRSLAAGVALLLHVLLAACSDARSVVSARLNDAGGRRLDDAPLLLNVSGPVGVDVESFAGSVTVNVHPEMEDARVTFARRATHGFRRGDEAEASLAEISTVAEAVPGPLGPMLRVRTSTTHAEPHFQRVDMLIELPEISGLRVHTRNGNVVARRVSGAVDVITEDGVVKIFTDRPMLEPVTIVNHSGSIHFRVRGESAGALDCAAVRGEVSHLVEFGELRVHAGTTHNTLKATFNDGTNPIVLRAADGDVRIAVVDDPIHMGMFLH